MTILKQLNFHERILALRQCKTFMSKTFIIEFRLILLVTFVDCVTFFSYSNCCLYKIYYNLIQRSQFGQFICNEINKYIIKNRKVSTSMDYQHLHEKRRDQRKFLRLKIITNRDLNFITAIAPDSTVTDLANRALNVYLQLSGQFGAKKQLTVAAVKQGRFFMPKSQIVSNLLVQDQQVQIIIIKAKPKFPKQIIPTQHDYQLLTGYIKNFDNHFSKRSSQLFRASQQSVKQPHHKVQKQYELNHSSSSSLGNSLELSHKSSQCQKSKRQRKIKKKQQKLQKKRLEQERKNQAKLIQKDQNLRQNNQSIQRKYSNQISSQLGQQKSLDKLSNSQKKDNLSLGKTLSQDLIENAKKKLKLDPLNKQNNNENISRKGSVDSRLEKTPKMSSVQSPKITFHFESKAESPKVLYIPESKNLNQIMANIQKQKDKLKMMSPIMLPRSSPKITFNPDPFKTPQSPKLNGLSMNSLKKVDQKQSMTKRSIQEILKSSKKQQSQQQIQLFQQRQPNEQQLPQQKTKKIQPEIIQEESSQEEQIIINLDTNKMLQYKALDTIEKQQQLTNQSSKRKNNHLKDRFREIQLKINKFKLQQSEEQL